MQIGGWCVKAMTRFAEPAAVVGGHVGATAAAWVVVVEEVVVEEAVFFGFGEG